jgi:eukaryotic-like serine/threonine-protein kinase
MPLSPSPCNPASVAQFLSDGLSDVEQTTFERHLETCAVCRGALEAEVGGPQAWSEAKEYLSSCGPGDDATCDAPHDAADPADHGITAVLKLLGPTDDPAMLGRLAGYEIVGAIGCGGMGVVLKGFDARLNRFVAIKLLAPHLAASGSARRRFAREAKAAAAVVHENVVAIHGVSEFQGLPYLVMPYVKGESLQKRLDRAGPLGVLEVLRITRQVAAGLAAAHAQGLIHRDIKPANILMEEGVDRLQLTDFGLARTVDDASETRTGIIAGTPQYMSPEQARGDALDTRSDLFSVGSVMYAMCAGRPPFRAETPYGILRRITDDTPRPLRQINPDTPDWLEAIVAKLHEKSPTARFASSEELAETLEQCLTHVRQPETVPLPASVKQLVKPPPQTSTGTPLDRMRRLMTTRRGQVATGAVAALAVTAIIALQPEKPNTQVQSIALQPEKPNTQVQSSASNQPTTTAAPVNPDFEWDRGASEANAVKHEVEELTGRAQKLWDEDSTPSPEMPP